MAIHGMSYCGAYSACACCSPEGVQFSRNRCPVASESAQCDCHSPPGTCPWRVAAWLLPIDRTWSCSARGLCGPVRRANWGGSPDDLLPGNRRACGAPRTGGTGFGRDSCPLLEVPEGGEQGGNSALPRVEMGSRGLGAETRRGACAELGMALAREGHQL